MSKVLTQEAEVENRYFERDYGNRGCDCFTGCAPCGWCTHPGNPHNQAEDESAWEEDEPSTGCGYQGSHFGAYYPDACCIDGFLWDLDSCDEPGGPLYQGGDMPCPKCDLPSYVEYHAEDQFISGNAKQRRTGKRKYLRKLRALVTQTLDLS